MRVLWKPEWQPRVKSLVWWITYACQAATVFSSVSPSYTLVLPGEDSARHLSEEHWHRKECISICFPPHVLSLTHSISICPFCVSGRCFKPWHKSTAFWVTFDLLFFCSVDVPYQARATENIQNQVFLMPWSSNVMLSFNKYPHEKLWNWVFDLAWRQVWLTHASLVCLQVFTSLATAGGTQRR